MIYICQTKLNIALKIEKKKDNPRNHRAFDRYGINKLCGNPPEEEKHSPAWPDSLPHKRLLNPARAICPRAVSCTLKKLMEFRIFQSGGSAATTHEPI